LLGATEELIGGMLDELETMDYEEGTAEFELVTAEELLEP